MMKSILLFFVFMVTFLEFGYTQGNEDRVTIFVLNYSNRQLMKLLFNGSTHLEHNITTTGSPRGIDYGSLDKHIYWIESSPPAIKRSDINLENVTTILSLPSVSWLYHLAVEKDLRKLFYTDYSKGQIVSMDLTGSNSTTIINSRNPRAIVIHSVKRQLIWSEIETDRKISSADYDGSNIRRIVNTSRDCYGLAVDKEGDVLYWSETSGLIQSVSLDGSNRRVIYRDTTKILYDLSLLGTTLYFTAYKDYVYRISVDGGAAEAISDTRFSVSLGLYVLSENVRACSPGVAYGVNCEKSCNARHCVRFSTECDPQTGQFPDGCELTWRGVDCITPETQNRETASSNITCFIYPIVGAVGTLLLVFLVLLCLQRQRRLQCLNQAPAPATVDNTQTDNMDGQQPANDAQQAVDVSRQAPAHSTSMMSWALKQRLALKKMIPLNQDLTRMSSPWGRGLGGREYKIMSP